jgi:hypothetical protein
VLGAKRLDGIDSKEGERSKIIWAQEGGRNSSWRAHLLKNSKLGYHLGGEGQSDS